MPAIRFCRRGKRFGRIDLPLVYQWQGGGCRDGKDLCLCRGGEFTVQVVAETDGGCVSDTVSGTYQIAAPIHLAWAPEPVSSIIYGNNIQGCAKVTEGEDTDITWHWVSPTTLAITGACANVAAQEQEYEFIVYATNKQGCASDTLMATTQVTGFGDLDVTLESSTGTEICKDGSALLTATVNGGQAHMPRMVCERNDNHYSESDHFICHKCIGDSSAG